MNNIKYILIAIGIILLTYFTTSYINLKDETKRKGDNFENILKEIKESTEKKLVEYSFKNDKELKEYLENTNSHLRGLDKKLDDAGIRIKQINKIVSTTIKVRDTNYNKIILDSINSILDKLNRGEDLVFPFEDKTDCFQFNAKITFSDGTASVEVLNRSFNDTLTHVTSWEKKKHRWVFGIKTNWFGRKIAKVTLFNKCGYSQTIVIDK